jgi:outer membrane protein assembly factor BamB
MNHLPFIRTLVVGLLLSAAQNSFAQTNWPEFRGPTADGHATQSILPTRISETENVAWKTPIHGKGWSSPVIWKNQVWLTTATVDGKRMSAVCADLETGKLIHDVILYENDEPDFCHPTNSYASPTPAIEANRVYVHFGKYGTCCLDTTTGKPIWNRADLECDHFRGAGSSPILFNDLLIVAFDGADQQYVIALDKHTGETVWKTDRAIDYGTDNGDFKKAYGTGAIFDVDDQPLLIYPSAIATVAYDPNSGKQKWIVYHDGMNVSARPLITNDGQVLITNGMGQMIAVDPSGSGNITDSHVKWKLSKTVCKKPSPILAEDRLYMTDDKGVLSCVNPATGKTVWQERLGGKYSASPILANGLLYFVSENGNIHVVRPGAEFDLVSQSKLGDGFMASPAVSGNRLIVRSKSNLYCIANPTESD